MFFVSSCNNLRDKPLLGTVRVPPPPPADKNCQSSREISENGRGKKFTKCNHYRYWDLLLIFAFCKAVKLPQFQKGIISTSPLASVPVPVQTTWLEACVAACRLQNSWRQNPSFQILNLWQDLGSDIVWYDLLSASNKKNTGGIQWGMLLFLSLVPCARSCYWVVLTQSHQHETVQFFLYHINLISFVLCFEAKAPYHLCQLCCSFTSTINSIGFFLN